MAGRADLRLQAHLCRWRFGTRAGVLRAAVQGRCDYPFESLVLYVVAPHPAAIYLYVYICMGTHSLTLSPHPDTYSHAKFWIVDRGTSRQHVGMSTGNWSPTDYPPADVFPPYGQGNWVKVRCSWERVNDLPHTPHRVRAPVCVLCCVQANRDYTMRMWGEEVVAQFSSVFHNDLIRGTEWYPANTTAL